MVTLVAGMLKFQTMKALAEVYAGKWLEKILCRQRLKLRNQTQSHLNAGRCLRMALEQQIGYPAKK